MSEKKLGFGLMRLPSLDPNDPGKIDIESGQFAVWADIAEGRCIEFGQKPDLPDPVKIGFDHIASRIDKIGNGQLGCAHRACHADGRHHTGDSQHAKDKSASHAWHARPPAVR